MPRIKKKKHKREISKAQDIILKVGSLRIYFQNSYVIISLVNDVLLGALYLGGSIATLIDAPKWISQWSYLLGAFFLLMRPILKILRNVFIYDEEEFQEEITDPKLLEHDSEKKDNNNEDYQKTKAKRKKWMKLKNKKKKII